MGKLFSIACASVFALVTMIYAAGPRAFTPELYRSKDGKESIALISADKAEHVVNGHTTTGKYVWKKNTLHLTLSAQGVSFTKDYRFTKEGLLSKNGEVLFKRKATFETVEEVEVGRRARDPETKFPAPPYSPAAREDGVAGKVVLSITVDDRGLVTDTQVLESSGSRDLDLYTRNWVTSRWRYPKGKAQTYRQPFLFKLRSEKPQPDGANPEISGVTPFASTRKNFPAPPHPKHLFESHSDRHLTLGMAVNANGEVVSTKIIKSSGHEKLDSYTADWVKEHWKFPDGAPRFLQQQFKYSPGDLNPTDAAAGKQPAAP
jgi:TonB family protein